jgi:hypothetical protein
VNHNLLAVGEVLVVDFFPGHFVGPEFGKLRVSCTQNRRKSEVTKGASQKVIYRGHKEEGPSRGASTRHSVLPGAEEKACAGN